MARGWFGREFWRWSGSFWIVALLIGPCAAQQSGLTGANDAYMQRQLRSLQGAVRSSPDSAALQLQRARRDLTQQGRGVALTPEQARVDRGLDQVGRQLQQERSPIGGVPPRPVADRQPLPSSFGTDQPLPSFDRSATVGRLVGRAETAAAAGRPDQARSDLAAARGLLAGVEPSDLDLTAIQARMTAVEARLDESGG